MSSVSSSTATTMPAADPGWRPFPFRRVLPVVQLLLCVMVLWPYRTLIAFELFGLRPRYGAPRAAEGTPPVNFTVNPAFNLDLSDPQLKKRIDAEDNAFDTVALLNFPAVLFEIPHISLSEDHREWMPASVPPFAFKTWRAVSWPVFALPFWWMAGRGAEALSAARRKLVAPRLRWLETIVAFLLMAWGVAFTIGFAFFSTSADLADPTYKLFAAASGLWGVLGSITVVARLAQWRIRKKAPFPGEPSSSPQVHP